MHKIPFHLVTGFLGSGKTTFLKTFLQHYADTYRIAVVQNEFAESGIDGKELRTGGWQFEMLEVNKGSVFCVCLFSGFQQQLKSFVEEHRPDVVLLEATGLADPIAISELLMTDELQEMLYLSKVWTIVDALNFDKVKQMPAVKNQILIADEIVINKAELVEMNQLDSCLKELRAINPIALYTITSYCAFTPDGIDVRKNELVISGQPNSPLKGVRTQVYRTPYAIKQANLDYFLSLLTEEVFRLKGYILLEGGRALMIQSVLGKYTTIPVEKSVSSTEIISIGTKVFDFELILRRMVIAGSYELRVNK